MSERLRDIFLLIALGLLAYLPGISTLPVIDRDEARYAQSVVQMVETGDYIDIRFQDEARYKKPIGAYWAQAAAIHATGQADDIKRGERPIWAQRLPSVLGALAAVIFTYLAGLRLFARREALIGAALLAVSVSLVFEAHQAKTDALLAGACACALYGLVARKTWAVWLALAAGVLIKGPVIIGVVGLALTTLFVADRKTQQMKWRWLFALLPIIAALAITLPWFIAIGFISDGAFYAEALGRDFGAKLGSAQETHGGPPGYYLLTILVMFWPGVVALPVAAVWAWRNRAEPSVALLLAWLVPMWLVLEIVPTKLPHYTLPLYPALALLCGASVLRSTPQRWSRLLGGFLFAIPALVFLLPALWPLVFLDMFPDDPHAIRKAFIGTSLFIAISAGVFFTWRLFRGEQAIEGVLTSGIVASLSVFGVGAGMWKMTFDISQDIANLANGRRVVSYTYREPSLVYRAGTETVLSEDHQLKPGDILYLSHPGIDVGYEPDCVAYIGGADGYNYAKGRQVYGGVFTTDACDAAELEAWRQRQVARSMDSKS